MTLPELEADITALGEKKFRAGQLYGWLHEKRITDFSECTNLSKAFIAKLDDTYEIKRLTVKRKLESKRDGTIKYLYEFPDGERCETVMMSYKHGNSLCISTQVGCRQGCAFCASTLDGLVRNLDAGEMLDEVFFTVRESGGALHSIVLMGIGEPLDNFDNVLRFLSLVNQPKGMNIGMRHITLSTCGIIERFEDLADRDLQLTLSVSLHAPDDETRSRIMPANHGRGVDALMDACRRYYDRTGRRISFEYAMIDGVNDSAVHAELLAQRARAVGAHVNLIPLNHVEERPFQPSTQGHMKAFIKIFTSHCHTNCHAHTCTKRTGCRFNADCVTILRVTRR